MRSFIAVNFPSLLRDELWLTTEPVRAHQGAVRWVHPESIHLTLKFLGEVDADEASRIADATRVAVGHMRPFDLAVSGFGVFPNARSPRVFWAGVEPSPPLELVQHGVEEAMTELGFPVEARVFRPHLTLARCKGRVTDRAVRGVAQALTELAFDATALVERVDLMQSVLASGGARYEVVSSIELRGTV